MFRTATGQTGRDAYTFEAAAIRNAQRDLDARAAKLAAAIKSEVPAGPMATLTGYRGIPQSGGRCRVFDIGATVHAGCFNSASTMGDLAALLCSTPDHPFYRIEEV